ncbi:MAG: hypothetical protein L0K86_03820, partial [Actinomycetia bacterium]|nr:hypothetical protein [Actinomycetes bacterium]
DLEDLPTEAPAPTADDAGISAASDEELLAAAAYAFPKMRRVVEQRAKQLRKATKSKASVRQTLSDLPKLRDEKSALRRWRDSSDPVTAAVDDLTAVCRQGISLAAQLREAGEQQAKGA